MVLVELNKLLPYIRAFGIVFVFFLASKMLIAFFQIYLKKKIEKTKTKVDDFLFDVTRGPITSSFLITGLILGIKYLNLPKNYNFVLINLLLSIIVIIITRMIIKIATVGLNFWFKQKPKTIQRSLKPFIKKTSQWVLWILAFVSILKIWEFDITAFVAGLGIAGIAVSLAVKDTLANIISGVSLIADQTFKIGEKIKTEKGDVGIVYDVGFRSTKIKTFKNEILNIPNSKLTSMIVKNYGRPNPKLMIEMEISVPRDSEIMKIKRIINKEIKKLEHFDKGSKTEIDYLKVEKDDIVLLVRFWVDNYENAFETKLKIVEKLFNSFKNQKIGVKSIIPQ